MQHHECKNLCNKDNYDFLNFCEPRYDNYEIILKMNIAQLYQFVWKYVSIEILTKTRSEKFQTCITHNCFSLIKAGIKSKFAILGGVMQDHTCKNRFNKDNYYFMNFCEPPIW